jgi:Domain of unknown function (DUF222)
VDSETLKAINPAELGDEELTEYVRAAVELADRVQAGLLGLVGEFDSRGSWAADGAVNARSWLAHHNDLASDEAGSLVKGARQLRRTTLVGQAVKTGELPVNKGRILARQRNERVAEVFDADEELLVKQAKELSVDQTKQLARFWQINADSDGPPPDDDDQSFRLSRHYDDRWKGDTRLNPEGGTIVNAALNQIMDDLYQAETADGRPARSVAQRRADALVEMARRATAARDDQAAARPLIIVKTDLEVLEGRAGRPAVTDDGIAVDHEWLRRLFCDANVCRVVMDGESVVIDVGRDSRTATPAQRRALIVRDGAACSPAVTGRPAGAKPTI